MESRAVFGTPVYQALASFKANSKISQVVSLHSTDGAVHSREAIEEARRLAKQMELRDAITMVFAPKA